MLKRLNGMFVVLSLAALVGFGCDSTPATSTGTGGAIGAGTGGAGMGGTGVGGAAMGTGGDSAATGGDSQGGGGMGGSTTMATGGSAPGTSESNLAILNADPPAGVQALDPSIAGTPKTYSNGTCQ